MRTKSTLLWLLLLLSEQLFAQKVDNQLWLNYFLSVPLKEKTSFNADMSVRGLVSNNEWNQLLLRPTFGIKHNRILTTSYAAAIFQTFYQDNDNVTELRLHQEVVVKWPDLRVIKLFYRFRLEERWFFYPERTENFNLRIRYLIGATSGDIRMGKQAIFFQSLIEGFNNAFEDEAYEIFINRTRLHFAIGHKLNSSFRYELHYIRQKSRQFTSDGLELSQNLFRLRFFKTLGRKQ